MAYARPAVVTDGDILDDVYFGVLRANWIAYETHGHTSAATDGQQIIILNPTAIQSLIR